MQFMNVALPAGPYDWDSRHNPREAFEARLARLHACMREACAAALLIHGNTFDYGALAYITGFVPKLGSAFAFIPVSGPPRLAYTGGPGMRESAARLTWLTDVAAFGAIGRRVGEWAQDSGLGAADLLGICGRRMSMSEWQSIAASWPGRTADLANLVEPLRRPKSPQEIRLIARARTIAEQVAKRMADAIADGHGVRAASLLAEQTGYAMEAQDVAIMASQEEAGAVMPFDNAADGIVSSGTVCVKARYAGYVAQFVAGWGPCAAPASALRTDLPILARPGHGLADMQAALQARFRSEGRVTLTGCGVGLSDAEAPDLAAGDVLAPDDVVFLHATLAARGRTVQASSTVRITSESATELT